MSKIKTRFAPSPTGYLHIGGLRTALYNYLFAQKNKGKFIIRIEDTDQSRAVKDAEKQLILTMQKIGLNWSEGPIADKSLNLSEKGQFGPYFQSKRLKIYQKYAEKLISEDKAYYCFCSAERLTKIREQQQAQKLPPKYDGCCRKLPADEIKNKLNSGEAYVIRLKVPEGREVVFNDSIRGQIKINSSEIDDQVLIKSDGFPTYHLANVVDDHLMKITHVIRGEEWLPSTPKHILLYEAFGWQAPEFAHLPLLLNKDKSKLSKRQGDVAVEDYLTKGYLPQALINYVALLGWHPKDDQEIFSLKNLIKNFSLERVQKAGAIFDLEKLNWFNSYYIKQTPNKKLLPLLKKLYPNVNDKILTKLLILEKERLNTLAELEPNSHFVVKLPDYNPETLIFKKSDKDTAKKAIQLTINELTKLKDKKFQIKFLHPILEQVVKNNNLTNGDVFWPVRVALSGQAKSPSPEEIMTALGKEESLKRLQVALNML